MHTHSARRVCRVGGDPGAGGVGGLACVGWDGDVVPRRLWQCLPNNPSACYACVFVCLSLSSVVCLAPAPSPALPHSNQEKFEEVQRTLRWTDPNVALNEVKFVCVVSLSLSLSLSLSRSLSSQLPDNKQ